MSSDSTDRKRDNATEKLVQVKNLLRDLESTRKGLTKPLNDHVKTINTFIKQHTEPLEKEESSIKRALAAYHQEQERVAAALRREREAELAEEMRKRDEEIRAERERAAALNIAPVIQPPSAELVELAKATAEPDKTIATKSGSAVTMRKVWKFTITDPDQVPDDFKIIDEQAIGAAVRGGTREIPGVTIYEDTIAAVR